MAGLYPHQHGVAHNRSALNTGIDTWPELRQQAGYQTGFFGKIHYATGAPHIPALAGGLGFVDQVTITIQP